MLQRDHRWVIDNLYGLPKACDAGADSGVMGVFGTVSIGIARSHLCHTGQLPVQMLHAPEAATGKIDGFHIAPPCFRS